MPKNSIPFSEIREGLVNLTAHPEQKDSILKKLFPEDDKHPPLAQGPLQKNKDTLLFEDIIKTILDEGDIFCDYNPKKKCIFVTLKGNEIDLFNLLKRINFTHIEFEEKYQEIASRFLTDIKYYPLLAMSYAEIIWNKKLFYDSTTGKLNTTQLDTPEIQKKFGTLSMAEKVSINNYTDNNFFRIMQNLLRGNHEEIFDHLMKKYSKTDHAKNMSIYSKDLLLRIAFCCSGLNKVDETPIAVTTVRTFSGELANRYKQAIDQQDDQGITIETGFISTSTRVEGNSFSPAPDKNTIIYSGITGKEITLLSAFPREQEIVMPPTQIQWLSCRNITNTDHYLFHARAVATTAMEEKTGLNLLFDQAKGSLLNVSLAQIRAVNNKTSSGSIFKSKHESIFIDTLNELVYHCLDIFQQWQKSGIFSKNKNKSIADFIREVLNAESHTNDHHHARMVFQLLQVYKPFVKSEQMQRLNHSAQSFMLQLTNDAVPVIIPRAPKKAEAEYQEFLTGIVNLIQFQQETSVTPKPRG